MKNYTVVQENEFRAVDCGLRVARGYAWKISGSRKIRGSSDGLERETDENGDYTEDQREYGYHGNDIAPCDAEYLCDLDGDAYLVLTLDETAPEMLGDWTCESASHLVTPEWFCDDGVWRVVSVYQDRDGLTSFAGRTS